MRSPSCITASSTTETQGQRARKSKRNKAKVRKQFFTFSFSLFTFHSSLSVSLGLFGLLLLVSAVSAQRVAILSPEQSVQSQKYASQISDSLSGKLNVLDDDMSLAAFRSLKSENAFNLTAIQAKVAAEVIGCDYFLLMRSGTLRRTSFARAEFYESFVTIFIVDGRSGRLVHWELKSFEADSPAESERLLFASSGSVAADIAGQLEKTRKIGPVAAGIAEPIAEGPEADSSEAKDFRPPMPYKRIKPEYTRKAYLYDVRATVDAAVSIDQNGTVMAVEIARWAGFGLDESVIETVRKMNWRAATRNGKALPMRVLLRYNFTKIDKD